jgi:hypothetical protein
MLTLPVADWPFRGHIAPVMLLISDQPRANTKSFEISYLIWKT